MTTSLLHRIVLPVDLGPETPALVAHGLRLAVASRAGLCLLHAHRGAGPARPWDLKPTVRELALQWGLWPITSAVDPIEGLGLELLQVTAAEGDLQESLWRAATALGPDLLVVGTERRHGLDRVFASSQAERLARGFAVGTLFIGQGMRGLVSVDNGSVQLDRLLVPVGDDVEPQDALDAAITFLAAVGHSRVQLLLLHVGGDGDVDQASIDALVAPEGVDVAWEARPGRIVAAILEAAQEVDLIVMVTRGHDSVVDDIIGSRTERVMREAPCPVLSVPLQD